VVGVHVSLLAVPGVMVKVLLVAPVRPVLVAVRVYPAAALLMDGPVKVATPPVAVWVVVPDRVPVPRVGPDPEGDGSAAGRSSVP